MDRRCSPLVVWLVFGAVATCDPHRPSSPTPPPVAVSVAPPASTSASAPSGSIAQAKPRSPVPPEARRLCEIDAPVDRVVYTLECNKGWKNRSEAARRYDSKSIRVHDAWVERRNHRRLPFTAYETARFDALLAEGLKRICKGEQDSGARYASLHRREFGWPLDACRGHRFITLYKGREKLELRRPLVEQMAEVAFIVGIHELGRRLVDPAGHQP